MIDVESPDVWRAPFRVVRIAGTAITARASNTPRPFDWAYKITDVASERWQGISIDPQSAYRELVVYFDDDEVPLVLCADSYLARPFRRVRVAPLGFYSTNRDVVTLPVSSSPATVHVRELEARVRLWQVPPPDGVRERFPRQVLWNSRALSVTAAGSVLQFLTAPNVRRVLLWGLRTANPAGKTLDVSVIGVHGSTTDPEDFNSGLVDAFATITIGANADVQRAVVVNPCETELAIAVTGATGTVAFRCGAILQFDGED